MLFATLLFGCMPHVDRGPIAAERAFEPVSVYPGSGPSPLLVAQVRAGSAFDPPGREGLAVLLAASLETDRVTVELSPERLELRTSCDEAVDSCIATFVGTLLAPDLHDPAGVRQRALERHRTGEGLASVAADRLLFEGHPYGSTGVGRRAVLESLPSSSLSGQHRRLFVRGNLAVQANGLSPDQLASLERALLAVPPGAPPDLALQAVHPTTRVLQVRAQVEPVVQLAGLGEHPERLALIGELLGDLEPTVTPLFPEDDLYGVPAARIHGWRVTLRGPDLQSRVQSAVDRLLDAPAGVDAVLGPEAPVVVAWIGETPIQIEDPRSEGVHLPTVTLDVEELLR